MRHLEFQIFVESHGSVYTELLWCAEHGRWSDPEDSSATGVCEDKIRSLTFLGVVLAPRSPVFSGPWLPLKSHGNACAPLSGLRTSFPVAFSRSLALPRELTSLLGGRCGELHSCERARTREERTPWAESRKSFACSFIRMLWV